MEMSGYLSEIKLKLTGEVTDIELSDATLTSVVNAALREVQRYIDVTKIITVPYQRCIDMTPYKATAITQVYRAKGYLTDSDGNSMNISDPMYMAAWQMFSGAGQMANTNSWVYSYAAWNTALQMRNTISTERLFYYDEAAKKLYINMAFDKPDDITIEYIPRYESVEEITSDFWIDIIMRLSVALTKVTLGRVRSKYRQTNALWELDGDKLLEEGNSELADLREQLRLSTQLSYTLD